MANLTRTAKSGDEWTANDLAAYNIQIVSQDAAKFFGHATIPLPRHNLDLFEKKTSDEMESEDSYQVARYMELAMAPVPEEESAVVDYIMQVLHAMGYAEKSLKRDLRSREKIPLLICGEWKRADADVCLMDRNGQILLIVQEDTHLKEHKDPHARLIAHSIAAVRHNNQIRSLELGMDELESEMMPGITMLGTTPTFFKIPVDRELIDAVQDGQHPITPTIVSMFRPSFFTHLARPTEGMKSLDNREVILACLEAFKQFVSL
ncbi:hypothetical protein CPB84DRAFT_1777593 [Gymnopilus junonius]|uniref:Uncharacterized protein n=1 Tax=Gymnopilus junonius TaxID=109634 RepID=A0A9P5TP74_GYMJU|nr:hypothetical protein CPB84DRAFT_1777593 [Gymnopilus junonius]